MAPNKTIALAAAITAALALAGCGSSEETTATEPAAPPPPATTEPATTVPTEPATTAQTEPATTEAPATETEPPETETEPVETEAEDSPDVDVFIQVAGGERIGGKGRVRAKQGDHVRIEVAVDAPQDIHLHGYELEQEATPDKPAVFEFEAELEGIFELESHLRDVVIADLVVEP
jgi:hypothetical protein